MFETYICHICTQFCLDNVDSIFCDLCRTWLHRKCLKMAVKVRKAHSKSNLPYFCPKCISDIIPFSHLTNYQVKSLAQQKLITNNICVKCSKLVNTSNSNFCISGKHYIHYSCLNTNHNCNHE